MISHTDRRTAALRPDLLGTRFEFNTPWVVVTGAPSSGKTTVLERLRQLGLAYNSEIARVFIEQELSKGRNLQEIRADEGQFQLGLIKAKLSLERETPQDKFALFDRAMPDSVTYYRVAGLDPNEALPYCFRFHYNTVFLFDRLPLQLDHARTEDDKTAEFLDVWLERDYRALGYEVVRVPAMTIEERTHLILQNLQARGLL